MLFYFQHLLLSTYLVYFPVWHIQNGKWAKSGIIVSKVTYFSKLLLYFQPKIPDPPPPNFISEYAPARGRKH